MPADADRLAHGKALRRRGNVVRLAVRFRDEPRVIAKTIRRIRDIELRLRAAASRSRAFRARARSAPFASISVGHLIESTRARSAGAVCRATGLRRTHARAIADRTRSTSADAALRDDVPPGRPSRDRSEFARAALGRGRRTRRPKKASTVPEASPLARWRSASRCASVVGLSILQHVVSNGRRKAFKRVRADALRASSSRRASATRAKKTWSTCVFFDRERRFDAHRARVHERSRDEHAAIEQILRDRKARSHRRRTRARSKDPFPRNVDDDVLMATHGAAQALEDVFAHRNGRALGEPLLEQHVDRRERRGARERIPTERRRVQERIVEQPREDGFASRRSRRSASPRRRALSQDR